MIERYQFTNSSMLASCEYDTVAKELTVTFSNGKDYVYVDVDKQTYEDLINAPSAGKHFNSIKSGLVQKS